MYSHKNTKTKKAHQTQIYFITVKMKFPFSSYLAILASTCARSSSASSCGNDPRFVFPVDNLGSKRDCNWLDNQKKRKQDISLYCETGEATSSGTPLIKDYCREACGKCSSSAEEDTACGNSSDKVNVLINGRNSKTKYCSWFLKRNRREVYCGVPEVQRHCPITCDASCDQPVLATPGLRSSTKPSGKPSLQPSAPHSPVTTASSSRNLHYSPMGPAFENAGVGSDAFGTSSVAVNTGGLGTSVAMNKSGDIVAIASPGIDSGRGFVQVFHWAGDGAAQRWIQLGEDIVGTSNCRGLGHSMDMNDSGFMIILGAPESNNDDGIVKVYEFDFSNMGSTWILVGNEIIPSKGSKGHAGFSVTMNNAGNRIAYGSPRTNGYRGSVVAMELVDGLWVAMGQSLNESGYYASAGTSVAMDAEGTRLVVGTTYGNWFKGGVDVLDYDELSSQWISVGSLGGDAYYDRFGSDVDISEDGSRIIVGAVSKDEGGMKNVGEVKVFEYDGGSTWNQLGQDITGVAKHDKLGEAVAISGNGQFIAVSSPKNEDNGVLNSGKVEVYKYSEPSQLWVPQEASIHGTDVNDRIGEGNGSIAMDSSGGRVAVGSQRGNYYDGTARAYQVLN